MRISTEAREQTPGELAWLVKSAIEGFARGAAPSFRRMRLPPLYQSGIVFAYEPNHGSGDEDFALPEMTLARGCGDCDDLIIYRLCELWAPSIKFDRFGNPCALDTSPASCSCEWVGENMHVQVRHRSGKLEDCAVLLGAPWQ